MFALQASIGGTNDVVDAGRDAGFKTSKPIPGGLVSPRAARVLVAGSAVVGVGLSALSGPLAVLVAFYSVLTGIAELHGAHWLWIADLSKPEQLPVRILPLLMILTQLLVAKITPTPTGADPRMARLMTLMSLVFGIVLYQQPSALMLYWLTSNLLQLGQQWWLGKRYA